jgi:hypothetical protein
LKTAAVRAWRIDWCATHAPRELGNRRYNLSKSWASHVIVRSFTSEKEFILENAARHEFAAFSLSHIGKVITQLGRVDSNHQHPD